MAVRVVVNGPLAVNKTTSSLLQCKAHSRCSINIAIRIISVHQSFYMHLIFRLSAGSSEGSLISARLS